MASKFYERSSSQWAKFEAKKLFNQVVEAERYTCPGLVEFTRLLENAERAAHRKYNSWHLSVRDEHGALIVDDADRIKNRRILSNWITGRKSYFGQRFKDSEPEPVQQTRDIAQDGIKPSALPDGSGGDAARQANPEPQELLTEKPAGAPTPDGDERKTTYAACVSAYKAVGKKMNERTLAKLADSKWNSRDPVAKWKQLKDRPGDDAKIRAAIAKDPQKQ